jgi:acetyl esterase/lipase
MTVAPDKPAIDAILLKVLEAVPYTLTVDDVQLSRRQMRELPRRSVHPELRVREDAIDGPAGSIPVRIYWPPGRPDRDGLPPVVVFFHGGGFAIGDLDTHDGIARNHAVGADAVVVSVDYRLAPEHPYPAGLDDCWAATRWVAAHGFELQADPTRLAVAGDSAGATLSAAVTQRARDEAGPAIAFQLLWYPATMMDPSLPSFTENADAPILKTTATARLTYWYAGGLDLSNPPIGMAPGRATSLAGLPPAYVAVAGHDPLRDDGIRYAELLAAAGVPVTLDRADTMVHGYIGYAGVVPAATAASDRGLAALWAALHPAAG